ncbi:hypothetical protein L198_00278 [Cryptococcus wingfieldii CBS 7118]|uniref:Mediator complex subunit 11 n=1 Tax=Cryptococcus wingfieldii CBS 7118 TaxID=1295528 RepID=A0A1E3K5U5_9TREE|nr:hypothetical protein L198_00278 [Cryptococcus wingfieldii CBS 7118]ODO08548.1 hypothetical protein L198_00278 [Cryptococcus wingfieldii CBS 7118]
MSSPAQSAEHDPLDLESLDADSLFSALTGVEKAIPEILLQIKPILTQLSSPTEGSGGDDESRGMEARQGVEKYIDLLDKIQFVLRQTVYYLRETKSNPNTLCPPPANNIPTPFASSIPSLTPASPSSPSGTRGDIVDDRQEATKVAELGLYASRIEARVLSDMGKAVRALVEEAVGQGRQVQG